MGDSPPERPEPVATDPPHRRRRRWRRWAIALAVVLAVAGGSWHALFYWAKSTGRLESWLGGRPERFQIRWTEIRSPLPFVFEVEGLVLAVRTRRRTWELTADRARAVVDPWALFDRRFVLREARASGAALRLANELPADTPGDNGSAEARASSVRDLEQNRPKITAFADQPAPISRPKQKPWSWVVSEIEFDALHEIWIDDLRVTGSASGQLGFAIERREWGEVYSSRLRVEDARVRLGGGELSESVGGELDLRIVPWRYHGASATDVLSHVQGRIALNGRAALGPALRYLFGDRPWLEIGAGQATLGTSLSVDRGRLLDGSWLRSELAEAALDAFGFAVRGNAALVAEVWGENDHERLVSRLELGTWTLARPGEAALFVGKGFVVRATSEAPRLDRLSTTAELDVDLGRGRADDLRFLDQFLPRAAEITVERGALDLTGKLRFAAADRSGSGELALAGERLALVVRGQRLAADLAVELRLSAPDFAAGSFAIDGSTLALRKVAAATSEGASIEDWWGETELVSGRVTLRHPFASAGEIRSRAADTRPVIAFYELKRDLPSWVEKALLIDDVRISGRYRVSAGRLQISDVLLPFTNGSARAELDLTRERRRARLLLNWRKLDLGVEIDGQKRDLHLLRAREWFENTQRTRAALPSPP